MGFFEQLFLLVRLIGNRITREVLSLDFPILLEYNLELRLDSPLIQKLKIPEVQNLLARRDQMLRQQSLRELSLVIA